MTAIAYLGLGAVAARAGNGYWDFGYSKKKK